MEWCNGGWPEIHVLMDARLMGGGYLGTFDQWVVCVIY